MEWKCKGFWGYHQNVALYYHDDLQLQPQEVHIFTLYTHHFIIEEHYFKRIKEVTKIQVS